MVEMINEVQEQTSFYRNTVLIGIILMLVVAAFSYFTMTVMQSHDELKSDLLAMQNDHRTTVNQNYYNEEAVDASGLSMSRSILRIAKKV